MAEVFTFLLKICRKQLQRYCLPHLLQKNLNHPLQRLLLLAHLSREVLQVQLFHPLHCRKMSNPQRRHHLLDLRWRRKIILEKGVKTSLEFASGSQSGSIEDELSTSSSDTVKDSLGTVMAEPSSSRTEHESFDAAPVLDPVIKRNINHHSGGPEVHSKAISAEAKVAVQYEKADDKNDEKVKSLADCGKVNESSDVHLNIRLHNGVSLREKFDLTSSLRVVKDYVDNQASGLGPYDLAVPYPRKVFSDEVPRQKASPSSFEKTNSSTNAHPSNETAGGYFGYVRRMLSYVNPFSYFSGGANSSSSGQDSQTGIWEYSPNSAFRNNLARRETNDSTSSSRNDSKDGPRTTSAFGSNIHTLKHDEDDDRFSDRNAFWNGNSTQYGGDNNGK
ncbi:hypothetical protein Patl1_26277 [Pistacia atlantica]|uniref:Uncharacterized protein n=1 Tax=Pistacia atlantica TaxID=434234 RepID=A0ACC1AYP7_9ROSI|nr:hypothetical protein Patl1_26277 [Pistacia atlantica]